MGATMDKLPYREHIIYSADALSLYVRDYRITADSDQIGVVLCLGGLTRNSKDFHRLALRLQANGYRVICPDYRGRGLSAYDRHWANYQPVTYLNDIRHIITALDIGHFVVVGTSLGGVLAMVLGVTMPASLRGVLLNDVCPDIPYLGLRPVLDFMAKTQPLQTWDQAIAKLQQTFPDYPASTADDWDYIARCTYKKRDDGMLVYDWDPAIARPLRNPTPGQERVLWAYFASLRSVPVAVLRAELSPFISEPGWQRMARIIPHIRRATVSGVGHAPALTEQTSTGLTDAWLADCFKQV